MSLPLTIDDRFAGILGGLCRAVAARVAGGAMAIAMITLVWTRVKRAEVKILALLVRFRAGRLWTRKVVSREVRVDGVGDRPRKVAVRMPVGFAWLCPLVPYEAAGYGSQLRFLLSDPEMQAFLAASAQARRILAPVCRMLGVEAAVLGMVPARAEGVAGAVKPVRVRRKAVVVEKLPPLVWPRGVLAMARKYKKLGKWS